MKSILLPTDFSNNAWNAATYGMALYEKIKCAFHLIHVSQNAPNSGGEVAMYASPELLEETILKEINKKLEEQLKEMGRLPFSSKHTLHKKAVHGFLTDQIKQEVKNKKIDLIIMGTKGASGLKAVSIGSNTGNVITKVPCAVLTVPEDAEFRRPKEIGFPTDFQTGYDIKVLENIKELLMHHKSALRFLYVSSKGAGLTKPQMKNRAFLKDFFADSEYSFHTLTGRKLDDAIQYFVESSDLDMLVMVAKNLNFLERILFRPTVEKISYHTKIPFLVVHEQSF